MLVGVADRQPVSAATAVESCGLWGCLLGAVLAVRLAQLSGQDNNYDNKNDIHCVGMYTTMNWIITDITYKCPQHCSR